MTTTTTRTTRGWRVPALGLTLVGALGCGDDGGGSSADAGVDGPGGDGGLVPEVLGSLRFLEERLVYDDGGTPVESRYSSAFGSYLVGRPPRWHQEVMRSTDCVLRRHVPSQCTPACTTGLCVATDVCEPFPTYQSAGRLTLTGLTVSLTLAETGGYYYADQQLPPDLFADDASITATLAGAAFPAHTLTAGGVPPIAAAITDGKIVLEPGQDHVLRWTPAAADTRVRVTLNANNRGHGLPYLGIIECDAPDAAGQVTIPAALVDGFPPTMVWTVCAGFDCPHSTIRRYRRGTAAVGGAEVELVVGSQLNFGVDHLAP